MARRGRAARTACESLGRPVFWKSRERQGNAGVRGPEAMRAERQVLLPKRKVLYLHGFEETENSPKPLALKKNANITLCVPSLNIYLHRGNSPLLSLIVIYAPLALLLTIAVASLPKRISHSALFYIPLIALLVVATFTFRAHLIARAVGRSFDLSYRVAQEAHAKFRPDVLVGFSWGGALACRLVEDRIHDGPLLLLAPAHAALHRIMNRPHAHLKLDPSNARVFHSKSDSIVPFEDSQALCHHSGLSVDAIEGEPHSLWCMSERLGDIVLSLGSAQK